MIPFCTLYRYIVNFVPIFYIKTNYRNQQNCFIIYEFKLINCMNVIAILKIKDSVSHCVIAFNTLIHIQYFTSQFIFDSNNAHNYHSHRQHIMYNRMFVCVSISIVYMHTYRQTDRQTIIDGQVSIFRSMDLCIHCTQ